MKPVSDITKPFSALLALLELGLTVTLVFSFAALLATYAAERVARTYLLPQIRQNRWNAHRDNLELTYIPRTCTPDVVSTDTIDDLLVTEDLPRIDAMRRFQRHGVTVIDGVLSAATAAELRAFILEENERNTDHVPIFERKNRWSFEIQIDHHPSVARATHEILSHPSLTTLLEDVVGHNPAVLECTAITVKAGALAQPYHSDSGPGANAHARSFVPAYSLFVALQPITTRMGATHVCPGTHVCTESNLDFCYDLGFSLASGSEEAPSRVWPVGSVAFLSQQTMHQGGAYLWDDEIDGDPATAPARVVFYITVAPRPQWKAHQVETRTLAYGGTTGQHWTQWGYTVEDYRDAFTRMKWPWRLLTTLGLYKRGSDWGWDYVTLLVQNIGKQDAGYGDGAFQNKIEEKGEDLPKFWIHGYLAYHFFVNKLHFYQRQCSRLHSVLVLIFVASGLRKSVFFRTMISLLFMHLPLLALALVWWKHLSRTSWARNIVAGRNAQPITNVSAYEEYYTINPPQLNDVLLLGHIQSQHLGSLSDELNLLHPGNLEFQELISENSADYGRLPIFQQRSICDFIIQQLDEEGSRFMTKSFDGPWEEVEEWADLYRHVHKELLMAANPLLRKLILELDYLHAETFFGYWRDTDLHQRILPPYLLGLQDRVMQYEYRQWVSHLMPVKHANGYQTFQHVAHAKFHFDSKARRTSSILRA